VLARQAERRMKLDGYECKGSIKHPVENFPQGKVRDLIGQDAGVSGKTVDKFKYINKTALSTKQLRAHEVWV